MVESLAFCSICFESYDQEEHVPLLLQCGHTFCMTCLTFISEPMSCPICRQHDHRPISELSKNILVYQIQAQLLPDASSIQLCEHEDIYFYCKVCKFPICVECVVTHSGHGLVSLKDPALEEMINQHIKQIESTYESRISKCRQRKEEAEQYL